MLACGGPDRGSDTTAGDGIATTGEAQSGESGESGEGATDTSDSAAATQSGGETDTLGDEGEDDEDSGSSISFDLQAVPDSPPYDESCGMVDFLFVIDNSGSMGDEQLSLINNFPIFINGIKTALDNVDSIHVGVTTTDNYFHNLVGCQQLGALVVKTGGADSSNLVCGPYAEGANYMTELDDLDAAFSCAAQVGTSGASDEHQMEAMVKAVNGTFGGVDGCNEGFIREDALLVVIIITDESDVNSVGNVLSWYQDVVDAKSGFSENIVIVSLIKTPGGICGFDVAQNIADFTTMFGVNGFMADICLPDYAPIFDEAVEIIDVACDNYLAD